MQTNVQVDKSESAESSHLRAPRKYSSWAVICFAIAMGISFRFCDLGRKVFWQDEVNTQCIIGPRTTPIDQDRLYTKAEVLSTAQIDKTASVADVVSNLAGREAEQAPFYYIVARIWSDFVGSGRWYLRLLSASLGVAGIAAAYFLGKELYEDSLAGGFAAALFALSPFLLVTGGQARPYSLWALTMTLSALALLRAMKKPGLANWLILFVALTLCLYTHLFSLLFFAAVCVWWVAQKQWSRGFIISATASLICLVPWLAVIPGHYTQSTWLNSTSLTLADSANALISAVSNSFLFSDTRSSVAVNFSLSFLLLGAGVYVFRTAPRRSSTFVISLFVVPALLLTFYSLFAHMAAVSKDRYLVPCMMAPLLCIAGALSRLSKAPGKLNRILYAGSILASIVTGLFSCATVQISPTWHNSDLSMLRLAEVVNRQPAPVIVCNAPRFEEIVLCYLLRDDARFMLRDESDLSPIPVSEPYIRAHIQRHAGHKWQAEYVAPEKLPVPLEPGTVVK